MGVESGCKGAGITTLHFNTAPPPRLPAGSRPMRIRPRPSNDGVAPRILLKHEYKQTCILYRGLVLDCICDLGQGGLELGWGWEGWDHVALSASSNCY